MPVAREIPWLPTTTAVASRLDDLGQQTLQRVALQQLRLERMERLGLGAAPLERASRASSASSSSTCAMLQPAWTAIEVSFAETSVSEPSGR